MADEQYPFGEAGSNDGLNEQGNTSDGAFDAQWYASQEPQASQDTSQAQPTNQMGAHYAQPGTQSSYQGSSYPYQDDAQAYQGTSQTPPQPTQTQPQVWSYGYGQQGAQSSYGYEQQNNWQEPSSSSTYQGTRFSQESVSPSVGAAVATPKSSHVGLKAAITGLVSGVAGARRSATDHLAATSAAAPARHKKGRVLTGRGASCMICQSTAKGARHGSGM